LTPAAVAAVKAWRPEEIVLLPLYPQFSTTTTASSLAIWRRAAARQGLVVPTSEIRSYPAEPLYVKALTELTREALDVAAAGPAPVRLLFSAHGLPLKIVRGGDPYPQEVAATAAAVIAALGQPGLDWQICYQSRVGPLKWLGPSTDEEIRRAGHDGRALVVAPIAFVSEHSETLVELDRDYRRLADNVGVPEYHRVPAVGTDPHFIAALARLVRTAAHGAVPQRDPERRTGAR
jgi:ferrochelatase